MGPVFLPINAADTLEWARCFSQSMLLIPLNGPIIAAKKMLPMATHGPSVSTKKPRNAADTLEWAQCFSQEMLLIHLNGPIIAAQEMLPILLNRPSVSPNQCCQYPHMGPLSLPKNAANTLEWANCFSQSMLPIHLDWPI